MFQGEHALENPAGLFIRTPVDHVKLRAHGAIAAITDLPVATHRLITFLEGYAPAPLGGRAVHFSEERSVPRALTRRSG